MITKPNIALAELVEMGADADLLREVIQYVAQRMMDMDVEGLCAAGYAERNPERLNSRNTGGYRGADIWHLSILHDAEQGICVLGCNRRTVTAR